MPELAMLTDTMMCCKTRFVLLEEGPTRKYEYLMHSMNVVAKNNLRNYFTEQKSRLLD